MAQNLCFTIRFLQPYAHGRDENGDSEWPPSPMRLFQALVAASAGRWNERITLQHAVHSLRWLESLPPPRIIAARADPADQPYRLYVPDNAADKVAASWSRGRDGSIADYRAEKDVRPIRLADECVRYVYSPSDDDRNGADFAGTLTLAARSVTHLGWGIDMAVGDANTISSDQAAKLNGVRWHPSPVGVPLRSPKPGTLDDLIRKHAYFLGRLSDDGFRPVPPLRTFDVVRYRRQDQPLGHPFRVFELRNADGSRFRYPHRRLIHIAGMVRHLTKEAMHRHPPRDVSSEWVESYVVGHARASNGNHSQLSYLPLPSIGMEHTDPGVRRMMIAAPVGDDAWLEHIARRLAGQVLRPDPTQPDPFGGREPPLLIPMPRNTSDGVVRAYTQKSSDWHSFTPVILPGHDDHKPDKTRALIEKALRQDGIDQPCDYEWSAFSGFPKSYSAHKYDRNKQPQGYIRPGYLQSQTAVHLTLRFHDGTRDKKPVAVPGPIAVGAGRHCGLGLFAALG